jgi:UDP-N-acetylglucosamine 1-carboxyvinyltransferase
MMAAGLARGETVINNAAREPEIVDLADMLNEMGACVMGAGSPVVTIIGVDSLHPVDHSVVGDRIEAGTFVAAAALAGTRVNIHGFMPSHLDLVLKKYKAMGIPIEEADDGCIVSKATHKDALDIQTLPFPGFPTDLQAPTMTLLSLADGNCIITENIFENRFRLADELRRMGADIRIAGHHAIVHGVKSLSGARVQSPDLRGGAALVLAGLVANGYTEVTDIYHIQRGYERFTEKLASLGADIQLVEINDKFAD